MSHDSSSTTTSLSLWKKKKIIQIIEVHCLRTAIKERACRSRKCSALAWMIWLDKRKVQYLISQISQVLDKDVNPFFTKFASFGSVFEVLESASDMPLQRHAQAVAQEHFMDMAHDFSLMALETESSFWSQSIFVPVSCSRTFLKELLELGYLMIA